jgi:hypothetical protein
MVYGTVSPETFRGVEGISHVITPDQYATLGLPKQGGRMSDLVLAAGDGYAFAADANGPVVGDVPPGASNGNHGYLNTNPDMRPIFVAWGAGIKPGARVDGVRTVDVAPTIARLLGIEMQEVMGKVVEGALK